MRVLIVTAGSWGDVAPYTGLAVRLREAGHTVDLATHARFAGTVTGHGIGFRPLPVDPREELASATGQGLARAVSPAVAMARAVTMARRFMPRLTRGIADAVAQGADVLISSTVTDPMCTVLAEAHRIPSLSGYLQPVTPTRAFPPLVTAARTLGGYGNLLASRALWAGTDGLFAPAVRALRRELGLPAPRRGTSRGAFTGFLGLPPARTVLHGFSPTVVPRPADWPVGHEVCGYWWPPAPPAWEPEPRLAEFLAAGPPPVFAGFGSFVAGDAPRLSALLVEAFRLAGVRGVVQSGWSGLHAEGNDVLTIGEAPHAALFPRMAAVIHHAGAGTTSAGLRAGVPAVPVPVQLDQHFWAARLHTLGVAPRPLRYQRLDAADLAAAIRAALAVPSARPRALAAALAAEDGPAPVLSALARL
ncbi:glycosyltransferase [Streptomyces sp. NPDC101132]|uniref:glycosyltransferase n=1 Tax=Streptomyces sp. NPDC101132 TaxID=3366110 RepID=UPI00380EAC45